MDKRTILAVVISVVIITVGFSIQGLFTKSANEKTATTITAQVTSTSLQNNAALPVPAAGKPVSASLPGLGDPSQAPDAVVAMPDASIDSTPYIYDNGTIRVNLDPQGASISSIKLLQYKDGNDPVEMFAKGTDAGLQTRFGNKSAALLTTPFKRASSENKNVIEFYREFYINNAPTKTFRITKKYTFFPGEFLFQLDVSMVNSVNEVVPLNKDGVAYTLSIGPQIGPLSSHIAANQDYRRFVYLSPNGRQVPGVARNTEQTVADRVNWLAIDGKYFSVAVIPGAADFKITLDTKDANDQPGSQVYLSRPVLNSSNITDTYRIYAGPKLANILGKYNKETDNIAGQSNLKLDQIPDGGNPIWWLEEALKWVMGLFYYVIPNWGIAIILLTILVKVLVYPLTKKSMISTARMSALAPRMTELREKYKDTPQKLNQEMAELYKKEKINPLGGCLPILLQFPFFFAMYNLFYNHFDLRGALFIPGWISDLSLPETVIHFNFVMPIFGTVITGLHILPFLYLGSQFLTTKLTQTSSPTMSTGQMKFMMYGLPTVFFFILYEVPSGLLVYWIFQNVFSIFQQQYINRHLEKMNLRQKTENPRSTAVAKKRKTK